MVIASQGSLFWFGFSFVLAFGLVKFLRCLGLASLRYPFAPPLAWQAVVFGFVGAS
jgi:hypothetical protein